MHEVWETEAAFATFFEEQLQPMSVALGTPEPEVEIRPVAGYRRPR